LIINSRASIPSIAAIFSFNPATAIESLAESIARSPVSTA